MSLLIHDMTKPENIKKYSTQTFNLMNIEYENFKKTIKKPVVYASGRDADRVQHWFKLPPTFRPHFYGADENGPIKDLFGRPVRLIYTQYPGDVRTRRKDFDYHDEAKILFPQRYIIDKEIYCGFSIGADGHLVPREALSIQPKLGLFDIEVESPEEIMSKPAQPRYPIVSIQFSSNYNNNITLFLLDFKVDGMSIPKYRKCDKAITTNVNFEIRNKDGAYTKVLIQPLIYIYSDEKTMLKDVLEWIHEQQFDAMGGYNSDTYDFPYLIKRCRAIHVNPRKLSPFGVVRARKKVDKNGKVQWSAYIKGIQVIDIYRFYVKWSGGRQPLVKGRPFGSTYDFHSVMEYECGFYYEDLGDKIKYSRKNVPFNLIRYCVGDAYALRLLEEKKGIVKYFERFRRNVGLPLMQARHNSRLGEVRILRLSTKPVPTGEWREKSKVKGAIVLLPKKRGVHKFLVIVDIKSLYPTLIMIYNLSPETLVPYEDIRSGKVKMSDVIKIGPTDKDHIFYFLKPSVKRGIIPQAVQYDSDLREVYREKGKKLSKSNPNYDDVRQTEVLHKFMSCSYYGMTGYEGFFLYSDEVREAITFLGREALQEISNQIEQLGYPVYYGDTDSLFVKLSGSQYREGYVVEETVNKVLVRISRRHGSRYELTCKFEHFCKRIIFVPKVQRTRKGGIVSAKKRYGYIDENDELHITGLAPRRSTTPICIRKTMWKWLEAVLVEGEVTKAKKIVRDLWDNFENLPLNQIGLPRSVKKDRYAREIRPPEPDPFQTYLMKKFEKVDPNTGFLVPARNPWKFGAEYMSKHYHRHFREDKKPMLIYLDRALMYQNRMKFPTAGVCITERDTTLPEELLPYIDWETMRDKVITAYFKTLFEAIGVHWEEVIHKRAQKCLIGDGTAEPKKSRRSGKKSRHRKLMESLRSKPGEELKQWL